MKHMNLNPIALGAAIVLYASICAPAGAAAQYSMIDIGIIGTNDDPAGGRVVGLNKDGAVAGWSQFFSPAPNQLYKNFRWTPTSPNGTTGTIVILPDPGAFEGCVATGLNDAGHMACSESFAWIWNGSSFTQLPDFPPGGFAPNTGQINNLEGVVGTGYGDVFDEHAIWWPAGAAAPVTLDDRESFGIGTNDKGSFVGAVVDSSGWIHHATAWHFVIFGVVPQDLDTSSYYSEAVAINDSATAIGVMSIDACGSTSDSCNTFRPVSWDSDGTRTDLPLLLLSGGEGEALGINGAGDIVGDATKVLILTHEKVRVATLWHDGAVTDLNVVTDTPDGWRLEWAAGINDAGQIAGTAIDDTGYVRHAVLLTPIPNTPPTALCNDVTVNVNASCQASASIDNGSSDPDGDAITLSQSPAGPYALGATLVTLTVTDSNGASSTCTGTVTALDVTAPAVTCPAPTSASANASCNAPIPNVLPNVTASDNCTAAASLGMSQSPTAGTLVGLGMTGIVVDVSDASTNANSCITSFTVNDTSAPSITSSVAKPVLWSPAHEMENVGFAVATGDNCDGAPDVSIEVYSNEPDQPAGDDDASFSPDALDIAAGTLRLRNERLQAGSGRVYLIVSTATDASGNASASCTTVVVPHDQNRKSLAVVNGLAGPAQSYCASTNGAVPAGYVQVGNGPVVGPKQ